MAKIDAETLYLQLGQLVASIPDLKVQEPYPLGTTQWLARAYALVSATGEIADAFALKQASDYASMVQDKLHRDPRAKQITSIVHRALAVAELSAPADVQGAFLPANSPLGAFDAVGKILKDDRSHFEVRKSSQKRQLSHCSYVVSRDGIEPSTT